MELYYQRARRCGRTLELERELRERLADLQREYQQRAKPIIDALAKIEAGKPVGPIIVPIDLAGGKPETGTATSEEER